MNVKQAKEISIIQYLAQLGHNPVRFQRGEHLFCSPFREEKKPSFFVKENAGNEGEDIWNDFGLSSDQNGGDIIELVKIQENTDTKGALEYLEDYAGYRVPRIYRPQSNTLFDKTPSDIEIIGSPKPLHHFVLLKYLREVRCIPDVVSKYYLKIVWYKHKKAGDKKFYSFGWLNQSGAYELRAANNNFKSVTGKKDVTYIAPKQKSCKSLYIFEGMLDFLSALVIKGQLVLDAHIIVLNTTTQIKKCLPYIERIRPNCIRTFFDNDAAGQKAYESLESSISDEYALERMTFYDDYKDVNDYLMAVS